MRFYTVGFLSSGVERWSCKPAVESSNLSGSICCAAPHLFPPARPPPLTRTAVLQPHTSLVADHGRCAGAAIAAGVAVRVDALRRAVPSAAARLHGRLDNTCFRPQGGLSAPACDGLVGGRADPALASDFGCDSPSV